MGVAVVPLARRVIRLQVILTVAIAAALALSLDLRHALSALCGGGIGALSAYVYAWRMSTPAGADAREALRAQYRAELSKIVITVALFALVFLVFKNVAALTLFLTYLATTVAYWVALITRSS